MNKTDAEIEKALECCNQENGCYECPYEFACYDDKYRSILSKDALDYINRLKTKEKEQQEEIEKYEHIKATINDFWDILLKSCIAKRKEKPTLEELADALVEIEVEAIKEFAERLTDRICENVNRSLDNPDGNNYYPIDVYKDIDNLVKEMTENEGKE